MKNRALLTSCAVLVLTKMLFRLLIQSSHLNLRMWNMYAFVTLMVLAISIYQEQKLVCEFMAICAMT